jgi:hypothetical protein
VEALAAVGPAVRSTATGRSKLLESASTEARPDLFRSREGDGVTLRAFSPEQVRVSFCAMGGGGVRQDERDNRAQSNRTTIVRDNLFYQPRNNASSKSRSVRMSGGDFQFRIATVSITGPQAYQT